MSTILPCPFCGGPGKPYPDGDMEGYTIMCLSNIGKCPTTTFGYATHEESVEAWNTRASSGWNPTDEELTEVYYRANGLDPAKHAPITTKRIFTAMRAMLEGRTNELEAKVVQLEAQSEKDSKRIIELVMEKDQLRQSIKADRLDTRIGKAVNKAAGELPEGCEMQIDIEKDAGTVILHLAGGDTKHFFDGDDFADYINSATEYAKANNQQSSE